MATPVVLAGDGGVGGALGQSSQSVGEKKTQNIYEREREIKGGRKRRGRGRERKRKIERERGDLESQII